MLPNPRELVSVIKKLWTTQNDKAIDQEMLELAPEDFGRPKAPAGTWASCIRVIDPIENKNVKVIQLDNNKAAFSLAVVPFTARGSELLLCIGTAASTFLAPRSCTSGYIRTYSFTNEGTELELLHKVIS